LYVKAILKGWKGLTFKYLQELVLVEVPEGADEEGLLEYTDDNALELMRSSTVLDSWVSGVIVDLGNFTATDSTMKSKKSKATLESLAQA
jgi:hypothetical protein